MSHHIEHLTERLAEWRNAGLITSEQAGLIEQHERSRAEAAPPRTSVAAEILGYLGGALALVAAIVLASQFWAQLATWSRLALVAVTTLAVGGSAVVIERGDRTPALLRLADFLHLLSTLGLAFFVRLLLVEGAASSEQAGLTAAAGVAAAYSAWLWWRRQGLLQHAALFVALLVTAVSGLNLVERLQADYAGLGVWGYGLAWGLLAWGGVLRPRAVGYALGAAAVVFGSLLFSADSLLRLGFGLASSAGLVAAGVGLRTPVVLGLGALGVFIFVPRISFEVFGDTAGGALALLISGVFLLAGAIVLTRTGRGLLRRAK